MQVCEDDLRKGTVDKKSKKGFNMAMNCLTSALSYCLVSAELVDHPLLGVNRPNKLIMAGIVRGLQHVKERSAFSAASFMVPHCEELDGPQEGCDYFEMMSNSKEPCSAKDIIERIEQAVAEAVSERSKEAAVDALRGLLESLED